MAQEVRLQGRTYSDVPSILLPDSNNVFHPFTDVSDTTATAADVATGKYFYLADGTKTQGTSSGGGGGGVVYQDGQGYLVLDDEEGRIVVDELNVTQNGTYTATTGHAYSPVNVNVSGGGGGSSWTFIASDEVTYSTSSTSAVNVALVQATSAIVTNSKIIYVKVRDKAGARNGYFYGSDSFFFWPNTSGNWSTAGRCCICVTSNTPTYSIYWGGTTNVYGIEASEVKTDGTVQLQARYNSTYSKTINGTYTVEIYTLEWPNDASPFV